MPRSHEYGFLTYRDIWVQGFQHSYRLLSLITGQMADNWFFLRHVNHWSYIRATSKGYNNYNNNDDENYNNTIIINKMCRLGRQDTPHPLCDSLRRYSLKMSNLTVTLSKRTAIEKLPQNTPVSVDAPLCHVLGANGSKVQEIWKKHLFLKGVFFFGVQPALWPWPWGYEPKLCAWHSSWAGA